MSTPEQPRKDLVGPAFSPAAALGQAKTPVPPPEFWRSLEHRAARPDFSEWLEREYPRQATVWTDLESDENRRHFLKLMGASLALAGLTACTRQPTEFIMPYVRQPEELVPGRPLFYATAMTLNGVANGVLAESHE